LSVVDSETARLPAPGNTFSHCAVKSGIFVAIAFRDS